MMILFTCLCFFLAVHLFMRHPQFGRAPSGKRLERIKRSPNYKDGKFQNISDTPALTEGATYTRVMKDFFFGKSKRGVPGKLLPTGKTDLLKSGENDNMLVWFGHSSYFLHLNGKNILVDPVLSGSASPVKFTTRSFKGSDVYSVDDLPYIDYLFITHDHYDHLDYETIVKLQPKVKKVITGLGVGAHFEHWGYKANQIIENDWNETIALEDGFTVTTTPARHFSGRKFQRNNTLWVSFVLLAPGLRIFIGGDSGYDTHFAAIGEQFGPFDLAILENGQYNQSWKYIHMMPEEVVQAAKDLKAKWLLPVHWSKFSLAIHAWDEPMIRVIKEANLRGVAIVHPMIGETVYLPDPESTTEWWEDSFISLHASNTSNIKDKNKT